MPIIGQPDFKSDFSEYERWHEALWGQTITELGSKLSVALYDINEVLDSPMEARMLSAIISSCGDVSLRLVHGDKRQILVMGDKDSQMHGTTIHMQREFGPYVADFVVSKYQIFPDHSLYSSVVVEVDGHDFHEKTKSQASKDKKRDRFFASEGIHVLHFSGSDVFRSAGDCANEVNNFLFKNMQTQAFEHFRKSTAGTP